MKNTKYNCDITFVLGSFNRIKLLPLAIDSIRKEQNGLKEIKSEIIVVDGGSTDGSLEWLINQKDIITVVQHNRGEWHGKKIERRSWGYFMNLAFKMAKGKYICMISDDAILHENAVKNGYELFETKINSGEKIGAVAFYFNDWPLRKKYAVANNLDHLYVNHGMYLKQALEDIGYIDEDTYMFYGADTDIILEMEQEGYKCIDSKNSFLEHYNDDTLGAKKNNIKQLGSNVNNDAEMLVRKWENVLYDKEQANKYRKRIGYFSFHENENIKNLGFLFNKKMDNSAILPNSTFVNKFKKIFR